MRTLLMFPLLIVLLGCTPDAKSGTGFTLPSGNAERGQETFVQLKCHACHTVQGIDFVALPASEEKMVALGGKKPYVVTYGSLVTSIINPSHRFAAGYPEAEIKAEGESKMRIYNDEMTITQLIDLVAFLQSHYQLEAYQPTPYMPYY
jgi:L-cysteine S-thiosulfotransferase